MEHKIKHQILWRPIELQDGVAYIKINNPEKVKKIIIEYGGGEKREYTEKGKNR